MNFVKYANDCFSETYCYIEVVFWEVLNLGGIEKEREKRAESCTNMVR